MAAFLALVLVCVGVVAPCQPGDRQPGSFSIGVAPAIDLPIGESADYFNLGGSVALGGEYMLATRPAIALRAGVEYALAPIEAENSLSVLACGLGAVLVQPLSPRLALRVDGSAGYYYGAFNDTGALEVADTKNGGNPFVAAGVGLSYLISPSLDLRLAAGYRGDLGLYHGVRLLVETAYYLSGRAARQARIRSALPVRPDLLDARRPAPGQGVQLGTVQLEPVFPILYKYYDDHPVGTVALRNPEKEPITDLRVSFLITQYMDSPKVCAEIRNLAAGESRVVDLNALFNDRVLGVTEGTKSAAEIGLEYTMRGDRYRDTRVETVRLYDRNAMTWDDDRKAAAFVTARDPQVLSFARNIVGMIRESPADGLDEDLQKAIAIHEALSLQGLSYVVDPRTPYVQFSKDAAQVDFLQFPRQTLNYKAGDCDDLSILYCALLESVGVETAFITVPGHIYAAFALKANELDARRSFLTTGDLIFREGRVWVPVEVTERAGGFLKAWESGARTWREHSSTQQASLLSVRAAWALYEPVGLPGGGEADVPLPIREAVLRSFSLEARKLTGREILPQIAQLEAQIGRDGGSAATRNRLGILYSRIGEMDKAEGQFQTILRGGEHMPALVNLGNIRYLAGDWSGALAYYERARRESPGNATALLALARTQHRMEAYGEARVSFEKLRQVDPTTAQEFAYLGSGGDAGARAAAAAEARRVIWSD